MNLNDQDLLIACQRNDRKAQFALYQKYKSKMLGICRRYAASHPEAEDVLQEAFIKVFGGIQQVKKGDSLGGWIRHIVVNTAVDFYRRNRRMPMTFGYDDALEKPDHEPLILEQISADEIIETMQQLPEGYRMVLNLSILDGYQHDEIAKMLGISAGTSKSQLSRGKELLRNMLKKNVTLSEIVTTDK